MYICTSLWVKNVRNTYTGTFHGGKLKGVEFQLRKKETTLVQDEIQETTTKNRRCPSDKLNYATVQYYSQ